MIAPSTQLKDMIHIERGAIPRETCSSLLNILREEIWRRHQWSNNKGERTSYETKELDVLAPSQNDEQMLYPIIQDVITNYVERESFQSSTRGHMNTNFLMGMAGLRFNRYGPGQIMRPHIDHIHTLFDGEKKGIPTLSVIGQLNDDYEGAKLTFWDDYSLNLEQGDIVVWPSLFLYPHHVTEATEGTRYSFVCWAF